MEKDVRCRPPFRRYISLGRCGGGPSHQRARVRRPIEDGIEGYRPWGAWARWRIGRSNGADAHGRCDRVLCSPPSPPPAINARKSQTNWCRNIEAATTRRSVLAPGSGVMTGGYSTWIPCGYGNGQLGRSLRSLPSSTSPCPPRRQGCIVIPLALSPAVAVVFVDATSSVRHTRLRMFLL